MGSADEPGGRGPVRVGIGLTIAVVVVSAIGLTLLLDRGAGDPAVATGGDPDVGRIMLVEYGCAACHEIPGVAHPTTTVGPSLAGWADQATVAGQLPNTPENLIAWIMSPQEIDPGNVMPDLGVPETDGRDMAAYLYTLEGGR